jgi:hypothetical protein
MTTRAKYIVQESDSIVYLVREQVFQRLDAKNGVYLQRSSRLLVYETSSGKLSFLAKAVV